MTKSLLASTAIVVGLLVAATGQASAAPIMGSLNMYGDFQPYNGASSTQNMTTANRIDFKPIGGGTGTFSTGTATGDLSIFAGMTNAGTIQDLTFNPFAPVNMFYTITTGGSTLTFDLTSLTINSQNTSFLTLSGSGTMHMTGFDDTTGNWIFSGQSSAGSTSTATFSWSAGSTADEQTSVPEPAGMALLGAGLLAAGMVTRRKQKKAA